ncbi:MAG TPA: PAS domain-containing protein, partial [Pyrinomonadaceae bacterium]|nr:PAS domain-containing protein [Pyrinomonadaceae bacterium]
MLESLEDKTIGFCSVTDGTQGKYCEQIPELYLRAMVDSYSAGVAVLDETGTILYVNRAWREFARPHGFQPDLYGVGCNYLHVRSQAADARSDESEALAEGVNEVLLGRDTEFQQE